MHSLPAVFISVDDHVQEHPEVWTRRLPRGRWGERVPHVERAPDGRECWVVDGQRLALGGVAVAGAVMGDRGHDPARWEEVPPSVYVPEERLKAMDADGVAYSILYPTVAGMAGETFGRLVDAEFELACVQAYNDWLIEEWARVSPRFVPQCIVPLWPVTATVKEIRRAVAMGHRGVIYPAAPMELRDLPHINEPDYDPIWATCAELGVPLCLHAGASQRIRVPPDKRLSSAMARAFAAVTGPVSTVSVVVNLLISRVLLRHPGLKVVFAESGLGWGAYLLEYTDYQFRGDGLHLQGYELKPSEMFRRQCYLTGWYDRASLRTRRFIGIENILWASKFPLATSLWPNSREQIDLSFHDVPEGERRQILWENAAALYRIKANPESHGSIGGT